MWLAVAEKLIAQLLEFCLECYNCGASFGVFYFVGCKMKIESGGEKKVEKPNKLRIS